MIIPDALYLAEQGLRVFQLRPRSKVPLAGSRGFKDATTDPDVIRRFDPRNNLAIASGGGIAVLDIDPRAGGYDALAKLTAEHGELPETPTVRTGAGGWHYYFAAPPDLRCSAGAIGPGIDVKAAGGYVVAPPSIHPGTGECYEWSIGFDTDPAPMPDWLLGLATKPPTVVRMPMTGSFTEAVEGTRNKTLASLAGKAFRYFPPNEWNTAAQLLHAWAKVFCAQSEDWTDTEILRTLKSIRDKELARRAG